MADCLFCAIAAEEVPADVVSADDRFVVFRDIAPQAPTHVLVIPREHHRDAASLLDADPGLAVGLFEAATAAAGALGLTGTGYRIVLNTGADGGQSVDHVHAHVLGGRQMRWPPG